VLGLLSAGCGATAPSTPSPATGAIVAAGDIADCPSPIGAEQTAQLLDGSQGTVLTLGDNAYDRGTAEEYANCYAPTWGRHKSRTRPALGNHDYETPGATGYFGYFGVQAGPVGLGYYSFNVGAWHLVSLDSNQPAAIGSLQASWLRADLSANAVRCVMAYWHHPVFSSGPHNNDPHMQDVWRILIEFGADVVLNGHDHDYERFAPQDGDGRFDPARGIREFVVGTGGSSVLYPVALVRPNSEVRENNTRGVLRMTLRPTGYDWEFVPVSGSTFRDSGSSECVG
jgi:3',5'-cyclic AMP phosphodiesterase CpdA